MILSEVVAAAECFLSLSPSGTAVRLALFFTLGARVVDLFWVLDFVIDV